MPVEKGASEPRIGVGDIRTEADKKADEARAPQPKNAKESKEAHDRANAVPVVEARYERGSADESVAPNRTQEVRKVSTPEPSPEDTPTTEVEFRKLHEKLNRPENRAGQGNGDHDQDLQGLRYSALREELNTINRVVAGIRQRVSRDPSDATFVGSNIPLQDELDFADAVEKAIGSLGKKLTASGSNWESAEDQHARINPQDRYDRNIVE